MGWQSETDFIAPPAGAERRQSAVSMMPDGDWRQSADAANDTHLDVLATVRGTVVQFLEQSRGEPIDDAFTDHTPFMDAGLDSLDIMKVRPSPQDPTTLCVQADLSAYTRSSKPVRGICLLLAHLGQLSFVRTAAMNRKTRRPMPRSC